MSNLILHIAALFSVYRLEEISALQVCRLYFNPGEG